MPAVVRAAVAAPVGAHRARGAAGAEAAIEPAAIEPAAERAVEPAVEALVHDIIGKVADRWTMLVLEALHAGGTLRYTQLRKAVAGISQKMLTQTVRQMERDGLVTRTVHPVIPPHVEYALTPLGQSLGAAFCGVWIWAETHFAEIAQARQRFDAQA